MFHIIYRGYVRTLEGEWDTKTSAHLSFLSLPSSTFYIEQSVLQGFALCFWLDYSTAFYIRHRSETGETRYFAPMTLKMSLRLVPSDKMLGANMNN